MLAAAAAKLGSFWLRRKCFMKRFSIAHFALICRLVSKSPGNKFKRLSSLRVYISLLLLLLLLLAAASAASATALCCSCVLSVSSYFSSLYHYCILEPMCMCMY